MKQSYHTIIRPERNGWFVGWAEEIPGTITHGQSLDECRQKLRDALQIMVETHRDEARLGLDDSCIQELMEIDVPEGGALEHPQGWGQYPGQGASNLA